MSNYNDFPSNQNINKPENSENEINQKYLLLSSKLGDIYFKINLLNQELEKTLKEIETLNNIAGLIKNKQPQEPQNQNITNIQELTKYLESRIKL
jgi:hypothetical protein